ncbi:putative ACR, YkgG family protein [Thermodesulfobium acidiphilum]|uniref:Putative ACR, YkgG family protein n=1 Tax=Thermodesulfobium acidiphilum TaxID=1794699 RepID=A0A2R4VZJ9_THEAF|nr:lactate utilization protein [Thermodesulfobium acidiphilum]AWB09932.1 putative ACR, YkgG family protein [Thermodesulfobium acidiphilum]
MDPNLKWHGEVFGKRAVEALKKNNFNADFFNTREELINKLLEIIPDKDVIGVGGSTTVQNLGILDILAKRGNTILDHNKPNLSPEEVLNLRRKQLTCDTFIASSNAITLDGKLVNTDGVGNRVASMIFGPKQVIIIAGTNKIVKDEEEARKRIKTIAAPINNKRLNRPNPCTVTGECMDCQGPTRICNITTILKKRPTLTPFSVFIINEHLGF